MTKASTRAKALFLDRDGVINIDVGYTHRVEDFVFFPGIFEWLSRVNAIKVVVTNQAGIGRGLYTEADFLALSDWMCSEFRKRGITIAKVYFSPFHPTHGIDRYRKDDYSRKPKPGMLFLAATELNLDLANSVLVGDKLSDIVAAEQAGVGTRILLSRQSAPDNFGIRHIRVNSHKELFDLFSVMPSLCAA